VTGAGSQTHRLQEEAGADAHLPQLSAVVVVVSRSRSMSDALCQRLHQQGIVAIPADSTGSATFGLGEASPLAVVVDATSGLGDRELLDAVRLSAGAPVLVLPASGLAHPALLAEPAEAALDPWTPGSAVRAQLATAAAVTMALSEAVLRSGPVELDVLRHEVRVHGEPVWFTLKEFELLELLLRFRGRVLSTDFLQARVWGPSRNGILHTLYVHIRRIRQKIEPDPQRPRYLLTLRGSGYKFQG
jgi:two-component system, OmpR family, response regulator RegX3